MSKDEQASNSMVNVDNHGARRGEAGGEGWRRGEGWRSGEGCGALGTGMLC